jgi:hypothetical protein
MKNYLVIAIALLQTTLFAQNSMQKGFRAFLDFGAGYTFNPDGPLGYDPDDELFFGTDYFTHGIKPSFHFGILYGKKACLGLAARYSYAIEISNMRRLKNYYTNTYPDLNVEVDHNEPYQLRTLEMGPIFSIPLKRNIWDAELLIGHASMVRPYLFITGKKREENPDADYYLYSHRPRQISSYNTITPTLSIKHDYGGNKYWFVRGEIAFGWGFNEVRYELLNQPYYWMHLGEGDEGFYYYNCPGVAGGIGINVQ